MNIKQLLTGTALIALGCALIVSNTVNTMRKYPQWLQGSMMPPVEAYEVFRNMFLIVMVLSIITLVVVNIKGK